MALTAATAWEVEATGSDSNGGGFDTSNKGATGVDMTYGTHQGTVSFSSSLSAVGTTSLTNSSSSFLNTMLGNVINIAGQGLYCIVGYTSTSVVTVDRALGTFTATSGVVGGALASPGYASNVMVGGNVVNVQYASYSITSATVNISGGCISMPANTADTSQSTMIGYQTARGDYGNQPVFTASGISAFTMLASGAGGRFVNLALSGANLTTSRGFVSSSATVYKCLFENFTNVAIASGSAIECAIASCTTVSPAIEAIFVLRCISHDNNVTGFGVSSSSSYLVDCISYNNTIGFQDSTGASNAAFINCTAFGNSSDGFKLVSVVTGNLSSACHNCLSYGNSGYGFNTSANVSNYLYSCFAGGNTSGNLTGSAQQIPSIVSLSANPFVNSSSANFALNSTAGGGALVQGAGVPGTFPGGNTVGYLDGGAVQHQGTSGGTVIFVIDD
jgi:hypothetical protein